MQRNSTAGGNAAPTQSPTLPTTDHTTTIADSPIGQSTTETAIETPKTAISQRAIEILKTAIVTHKPQTAIIVVVLLAAAAGYTFPAFAISTGMVLYYLNRTIDTHFGAALDRNQDGDR